MRPARDNIKISLARAAEGMIADVLLGTLGGKSGKSDIFPPTVSGSPLGRDCLLQVNRGRKFLLSGRDVSIEIILPYFDELAKSKFPRHAMA